MINEIVKTASELIKFPSVHSRPRDRRACSQYIEEFFKSAQVPVEIWEPGDVRSLVVKLGKPEVPTVCLLGHYDVVESRPSGFRPKHEGDKLHGRGAADMKSALAVMMHLAGEMAARPNPPSLALLIAGDEEVGGEKGTAHILKMGFRARFAIAAEPTNLAVANQSKGVLGLELTAEGKAGHSARPWEGENAIFTFFRQFPAIWEIFGDPAPFAWRTTMVPTTISAGDSTKRIPQELKCRLDIRYVPMDRPEELVKRIEQAAPEIKIKVVEEGKALYTDPQDPYLACLRHAAQEVEHRDPGLIRKHASSDARHFSSLGIPAAVFGPSGGNVHGDNEWVDVRQVAQFHKVLEKFVDDAQKVRTKEDKAVA